MHNVILELVYFRGFNMICTKCKCEFQSYDKGKNSYCKPCKAEYMKGWYKKANFNEEQRLLIKKSRMVQSARKRSVRFNVPFDMCRDDFEIPSTCPALGILMPNNNKIIQYNSPTIDRIIPELGYIKGNIVVISMKANLIKTNATYKEIRSVSDWLEGILSNNFNF